MTHGHELQEGNVGGRACAGWSGVRGGKWDNCNSIINKYIKKNLFLKTSIIHCFSPVCCLAEGFWPRWRPARSPQCISHPPWFGQIMLFMWQWQRYKGWVETHMAFYGLSSELAHCHFLILHWTKQVTESNPTPMKQGNILASAREVEEINISE